MQTDILRGRVKFPTGGIVRERETRMIRCNSETDRYSPDGRRMHFALRYLPSEFFYFSGETAYEKTN